MPIISAIPFIETSYVLVQANWADVPAASCVQVLRVRVDNGTEAPLRPYIAPCGTAGEFIETSGGHATFWDTEAPLDTAFFYRTQADGVTFPDREIRDSFSRVVVDNWGTTDSLHVWTPETTASEFDVNGSDGTISNGSVSSSRRIVISDLIALDSDQYITFSTPVTATGATIVASVASRYMDANNHYRFALNFTTTGNVDLQIVRRLASTDTGLVSTTVGTYTPNQRWRIRARTFGSTLQAKAWPEASTEPVAWQVTTTDTTFLQGTLGVRTILNAGNTNTLPVVISTDNYLAQVDFMSLQTEPLSMPSNGYFWLKDPVRPCNDRRLTTSKMLTPNCPPSGGLFFLSIDQENYASNATKLAPTNATRLIQFARDRRDANTVLIVLSRTFQDRDDTLALNAPNSPLLFQAAPNYGIPDRYMAIDTVSVARGLPDHRYEPRILTMPYDTVDRPVGTTQGICGSRFMDLCDIYPSWDAMTAAGLTYEDLVTGAASQPSEGFATWNSVEAEFTDWDDVEASNVDWDEVEGGGA